MNRLQIAECGMRNADSNSRFRIADFRAVLLLPKSAFRIPQSNMPDWKHIIRTHLDVLRLPPEREMEITEELALHLEGVYEDALAAGLSEAEAEARVVQGYDWRLLECELSRVEQPLAARAFQPTLELI